MNTIKDMTTSDTTTHKPMHKKWLYASLAAAALTLGACADKEAPMSEDETAMDAQVEVEQDATSVDDVEQVTEGVNSADISDDPMVNDDVAVATVDESEVTDDAEILDGSESEEHVSTY
ncbi:hypothetical protein AAIR29_10655 [Psychrobacter sp. FBL11]|uniref:Lipoprotein n=1 Tax=Psychrobacter saeujeotis TaxID=3143436 RepID=A0ABU9X9J0_9GAMM|nr:hypothetical protein [uncultured Psychrobacter sp.]